MADFAGGLSFPLGGDIPDPQIITRQESPDLLRLDIALAPSRVAPGRFGFRIGDDGDVAFDDTQAHSVMTSVMGPKRGNWADQSDGSDVDKLGKDVPRTPSQAEAFALDGMQSLEDAGDITNSRASARTRRTAQLTTLAVELRWDTPTGTQNITTPEL